MELTTKKKSYRWNRMVPRNTTLEIAKTFAIKRGEDPQTNGLKLLNESVQECGLDTRLVTWDDEHPLFKEAKAHWEAVQKNDPQKTLGHVLLETNQHIASIASSLKTFLEFYQPAAREKIPVVVKAEEIKLTVKEPKQKAPAKTGRWSQEEAYGSSENKKELGLLLAAARGNLSAPGEKLWTQRRVVEAIKASPYCYEAYIDYTGGVRSTFTQATISGVEIGKLWPCAKAIHALVEFYKLETSHIETILGLIPEALRHSIRENLGSDTRLVKILNGDYVDEATFQEALVQAETLAKAVKEEDLVIPKVMEPKEQLGEIIPNTPPLRIGILGPTCKASARAIQKGFGRHEVTFVDGERPKSIPNTKFDAVMPLNRVSHTVWLQFLQATGNPPQIRFKHNGFPIKSLNGLIRWLELYDKGLIVLG